MSKIYLKIENETVQAYGYEISDFDKIITVEEWNQSGNFARIEKGKIVVGLGYKEVLEKAKASKLEEINEFRDRAEQGGFEYLGKMFDSDTVSIQRLTVASNTAMISKQAGVEFLLNWTLQDDSYMEMDAEKMLGVLPALAMHSNNVHVKARGIKDRIELAQTLEDLEAIIWEI